MKNKENVSDLDSSSSSSWIIINKESPTVREEIQDVEISGENSDIESDSDGISVISESDSLNEEKCMETYDDIINYKDFDNYNCNRIVCRKNTSQCDFDGLSFWGLMSCILCAGFSAFVTLHGHLYLKQTEFEIKTRAIVIDSTVGCVDAFKIHEMHYNKSYLKQCVLSIINNVEYGVSVEEAIRRFNFNESKTIPVKFETKEDLEKKFNYPAQKSKCKKMKPVQNNSNNKDTEINNMKATCKLKAKKGNFKKNQNKDITGEWYLDLHKARNEIRSREHDADWFFDRANIRNKKRNSAMWYFSYMKMREKHRFKSLKKENS